MANNRLYIINPNKKEYICIAKHDGYSWNLGNVDLLREFLEISHDFTKDTSLKLLTELNDEMLEIERDKEWININTENKWEYS